MANNLPRDKQISVVSALVEGCSIRSTMRMTGVNRETIGTLLVRVGDGCADLLSRTMVRASKALTRKLRKERLAELIRLLRKAQRRA